MEHSQYPGLEIDADLRQQRREWAIQRIAWTLLYTLLLGIILGLLGRGPLSSTVVASKDGGLRLEYERFLRHRSNAVLHITLRAASDKVQLKLDSAYLQRIDLEQVTPDPERVIAGSDSVTFVFNTRPGASVQATVEYFPQHVGMLHGWIGVDDGPMQAFSQFVYP
jgi:hypothetical protein